VGDEAPGDLEAGLAIDDVDPAWAGQPQNGKDDQEDA
jgi:hypothetical protein